MTGLPPRVVQALARVKSAQPCGLVDQPRAVVVNGPGLAACVAYCGERGYEIAVADAGTALSMLSNATASVIVVHDVDDLAPFVEVASAPPRARPVISSGASFDAPARGRFRRPELRRSAGGTGRA